jgi:glycosyltransferase involved in cell wall biosynthesis
MTIGYYISKINASDGGIYQYSVYILKMLLSSNEIKKIYLFYSLNQKSTFGTFLNHSKVIPVLHDRSGRIYNYQKKLAEFFLTRYYLRQSNSTFAYKLYSFINPDRRFLNRFKPDVLHVPRQHSPSYNLNYPVVVSMHDVQQLHYPEFFSPLERIYRSIGYYTSLSEASHVIVSYEHVKKDIKKYFKSIAADVTVCAVPMNEDWTEIKAQTDSDLLKKKYNLPDKFILTPAATWEHKNHRAVLEALSILHHQGEKVFWVSTGNKTAYYSTIEEKIKELGLEDQVIFTGLVSDADLVGLFKMTSLVVIPTLYEAGSGPLFEAMRYQVPVICSNITSLPDTIRNDEFLFDPHNYKKIAELISVGLSDKNFIERNKANSLKRITELQNGDFAPAFLSAYQSAIEFHKNKSKSA